jgi:hypothetical protein
LVYLDGFGFPMKTGHVGFHVLLPTKLICNPNVGFKNLNHPRSISTTGLKRKAQWSEQGVDFGSFAQPALGQVGGLPCPSKLKSISMDPACQGEQGNQKISKAEKAPQKDPG